MARYVSDSRNFTLQASTSDTARESPSPTGLATSWVNALVPAVWQEPAVFVGQAEKRPAGVAARETCS